jgi:Ca2+:H+ antiporter
MSDLRQRANGGPVDVENGAPVHSDEKPQHHIDLHIRKHRLPRGVHKDGESNRRGFHPMHFFKIVFRSSSHFSMVVNILWPFVPVAIALYCLHREDLYRSVFATNFLAMIPAANLIGFAGQELARKLPKVFGMYTG